MDKDTLHRILVNPTRTGLDRVEKEVARLRGVNDILRKELVTWKDAVTARNVTIEGLNDHLDQKSTELMRLYHELQEAATIVVDDKKKDAVQVEKLRVHTQAAHSTLTEISGRLTGIIRAIKGVEAATCLVRNSIVGDVKIDWEKELDCELDNTCAE